MDVKSAGKLGRRLRQLICACDSTEVERLLRAMPPEHVAPYRFSCLRLSLLHLLAERNCWCWLGPHRDLERLARWLIRERGCEVDARDVYGMTPLWLALRKENVGVVRALIAGGATVNDYIPPRPKPPRRYLKWQQLQRYHDHPIRMVMPRSCCDRLVILMLDAGYYHPPRLDCCVDPCWWCNWLEYRATLWNKTLVLLGVWQRRQPNATQGVDRHVMRYIVQLVWKRRFVWYRK